MTVQEAIEQGIIKSGGVICPFCDKGLSIEYNYCCGEAGHGMTGYIIDVFPGEVYSADMLEDALEERQNLIMKREMQKIYRKG